jgi:hypothetical protein
MSRPKKPRNKTYTPRPANVPMMVALATGPVDADGLAFKLHAAILTMVERPTTEHCNNLTQQLCALTIAMSLRSNGIQAGGPYAYLFRTLQSAIKVIEAIIDRFERTGALGVAGPETATLHAAAQVLDPNLHLIPEALYRAAEKIATERMGKAIADQLALEAAA